MKYQICQYEMINPLLKHY